MYKITLILRRTIPQSTFHFHTAPTLLRSLMCSQRLYSRSNIQDIQDHNNKLYRKVQLSQEFQNEKEKIKGKNESEEEVTDSEQEFQNIVDIDQIIKNLQDNTYSMEELHQRLFTLISKMHQVKELLEFDSDMLKEVFTQTITQELIFFSNYDQLLKIVQMAYVMQLPYQKFWQSVVNTLLINFSELPLSHLVSLCYYLSKLGIQQLFLEVELLPEIYQNKATKLNKFATSQFLSQHIRQLYMDNHSDQDILTNFKLAYLVSTSSSTFSHILNISEKDHLLSEVVDHLQDNHDGLLHIIQEFNYDQCIDFLRICPTHKLNINTLELIIALFSSNSQKKSFYDGRQPSFSDINLILNKLKQLQVNKHNLESWDHIVEVVRVLLTKTLVNSREGVKEEGLVSEGQRMIEDLEFIHILKNHEDLGIVDQTITNLVLFELLNQIGKEKPFGEKEEAHAKLGVILHVLKTYEVGENEKVYIGFHQKLRERIFESEAFDLHLGIEEYLLLREISGVLKRQIKEESVKKELDQQVEYLERKVHNYSQLYNF